MKKIMTRKDVIGMMTMIAPTLPPAITLKHMLDDLMNYIAENSDPSMKSMERTSRLITIAVVMAKACAVQDGLGAQPIKIMEGTKQ